MASLVERLVEAFNDVEVAPRSDGLAPKETPNGGVHDVSRGRGLVERPEQDKTAQQSDSLTKSLSPAEELPVGPPTTPQEPKLGPTDLVGELEIPRDDLDIEDSKDLVENVNPLSADKNVTGDPEPNPAQANLVGEHDISRDDVDVEGPKDPKKDLVKKENMDPAQDKENAAGNVDEKKKKKKSSGKNKKPAPTGFEEFYADAPVTPDEHEEELEQYATAVPLDYRIELCLQKYKAKRRFDNVRLNIFSKYLLLGGIDSTLGKSYNGGVDKEVIDQSTKEQIAAINATDTLWNGGNAKFYNPQEPDGWVVDFTGVVKGFLSYRAPEMMNTHSQKEIQSCCAIVRNFLNYILVHGVCKEYTEDVTAAREMCDTAEKELWALQCISNLLPGTFNKATSRLFGGQSGWAHDWEVTDDSIRAANTAAADRVFKTAVALSGDDGLFREVMKGDPFVVKTYVKWYKIVSIHKPTAEIIANYAGVLDAAGNPGSFQPLGSFTVKQCHSPGFDEEDFTDDESDDLNLPKLDEAIETFWIEDEALRLCFEGLMMQLKVRELNVGIKYFEISDGPYVSFFTYLPQEKMKDWKEPIPNTRPAPTEDDVLDADEEDVDGDPILEG